MGSLILSESESRSVVSNSLRPYGIVHGILQARILDWVAVHFSRVIFLPQGLKPGLWHCRQILYQLSHQGSPILPALPERGSLIISNMWNDPTQHPLCAQCPARHLRYSGEQNQPGARFNRRCYLNCFSRSVLKITITVSIFNYFDLLKID